MRKPTIFTFALLLWGKAAAAEALPITSEAPAEGRADHVSPAGHEARLDQSVQQLLNENFKLQRTGDRIRKSIAHDAPMRAGN